MHPTTTPSSTPSYTSSQAPASPRGHKAADVCGDVLLSFLTIFLPPAVAYIRTGKQDLVLNIILTLLLWFPGMLHAWYLLVVYPPRRKGIAYERGIVLDGNEAGTRQEWNAVQGGEVAVVGDKEGKPPVYGV